jgi:hypothetical protein
MLHFIPIFRDKRFRAVTPFNRVGYVGLFRRRSVVKCKVGFLIVANDKERQTVKVCIASVTHNRGGWNLLDGNLAGFGIRNAQGIGHRQCHIKYFCTISDRCGKGMFGGSEGGRSAVTKIPEVSQLGTGRFVGKLNRRTATVFRLFEGEVRRGRVDGFCFR